jgi:Tlde1 domain
MSYRTRAPHNSAARNHRNSSGKTNPYIVFGGAAVVLGCAWIVYANVFGASVFPTTADSNFDVTLIKRTPAPAVRNPPPVFDDVFAALSQPAPLSSTPVRLTLGPSLTFSDRFAAASPQGEAPKPVPPDRQVAAIAPPQADRQVAQLVRLPTARPAEAGAVKNATASARDMTQGAKAAMLAALEEKPTIFEKLFGKLKSAGPSLAFASADASVTGSLGSGNPGQSPNSALGGSVPYDRTTAVYDISKHTVYMPDGTRLEAHSGLGSKLDDPRFVNVRMLGPTPPHVYDLQPRETLFHGVPALRLNPVGGEDAIFGRTGLLAHTYMLGPNGDSNGCVSFKDYNAFLQAYRNGEVKRLAVVTRVE